jgi:hypothetical protein
MEGYRYKRGEYVEDSTRGKALAKPRTYKGDALVQAWVDRRKLAVLSEWLDNSGHRTKFLSDVLKFTIDIVVDQLIENGLAEKIELTEDAVRILDMKYSANLNPNDRGKRNLVHNLQLDEIRKGHSYDYEISRPIQKDDAYAKARMENDILMKRMSEMEASGELAKKIDENKDRDWEAEKKAQLDKFEYDERGIYIGQKKAIDSKPAKHLSEETLKAQDARNKEKDKFYAENDMMPPGYEEK